MPNASWKSQVPFAEQHHVAWGRRAPVMVRVGEKILDGFGALSSVNYFSRSTTIRIPGYLPVFLHHLAAKC